MYRHINTYQSFTGDMLNYCRPQGVNLEPCCCKHEIFDNSWNEMWHETINMLVVPTLVNGEADKDSAQCET
jgi:hypothetical protein